MVDQRRVEAALHLLRQVRRQPHGGGRPLRRGRRAGGQGARGAVRRDPRPRLAHLLRRHRRQARVGQAPGGAHARHGVRPQRREHQHAGLRHRARRHAGRRPCHGRLEPHAQHRHQPLRHPRRARRDDAQRRAFRRELLGGSRARRRRQDHHLPGPHHLPEGPPTTLSRRPPRYSNACPTCASSWPARAT